MTTWLLGLFGASLLAVVAAGAATTVGSEGDARALSGNAAGAEPGSRLPEIGNLRQEVVLDGAIVNGNRLYLSRFTDGRSAETLLEEVRGMWSHRAAPIHSMERDGWLVMTQVAGASIETIELRRAGLITEGRWSRMRRGDGGLVESTAWLEAALPPGSHVLNRVAHDDGGRRLATVVAKTTADAADASQAVAFALRRRGFRIESRKAPSLEEAGRVLFLSRGREEVAVTVSEHGEERAVVMHWGSTVP